MTHYPIGVVGESFENDDGSSRQAEIALCAAGERVWLHPDPDNRFDAKCVKVMSVRGVQIGNIARKDGWIAQRLDRGAALAARILSIHRAGSGDLAVVLDVWTG